MKNLKLLIISNGPRWNTWESRIPELRQFFQSKANLQVTLRETDYDHKKIPWVPDGNGPEYFRIEDAWYDANISSQAQGFDIVLFVLPVWQWHMPNKAWGFRTDRNQGPVELHIAANEGAKDDYYKRPDGTWEKVDMFFNRARHEILHALFMLTGQFDTTHQNVYATPPTPEKALHDIVFPDYQQAELARLTAILNGILKIIELLMATKFTHPIPQKPRITQRFLVADSTNYPKTGVHPGVDYGTQGATMVPVYFVADGEVIESGFHGAFGNYFFLYVPGADRTFAYFHLAGVAPRVGPAKRGVACGFAGDTGQSDGIHLHLECIKGRVTSADRKRLFTSKENVAKYAEDADAFIKERLI